MTTSQRKAAFLDRDGVINHDLSYIGHPKDFVLADGVPEALHLLSHAGFELVVVTNQSGIGRGFYSERDYERVTDHMQGLLASYGIKFAAILHCPHVDDDRCDCRKPKPGLLLQGAAITGVSLAASVLFGDKETDIKAGRAAGVGKCFIVGTTDFQDRSGADGAGADLLACVRQLLVVPGADR